MADIVEQRREIPCVRDGDMSLWSGGEIFD